MQRAIISTPIPTLEEVAKNLGMSKRRQSELLTIVRKHTQGVLNGRRRDVSDADQKKEDVHPSGK